MRNKTIFFVLVLLFVLAGCSDNEPVEVSPSLSSDITTPAPSETVSIEPAEPVEPEEPIIEVIEMEEHEEPPLQVYPLNVGMAYYNYAVEVPEHIYNTLGSENGLAGTIYLIDATVKSINPIDLASVPCEYAIAETDKGEVLILNMYAGIYNATATRYGEMIARDAYSDNPDYYVFPPIGEKGSFLVVYTGYSQTENMPVFELGASADIFEIEEYPDPVAAMLSEIPVGTN